MKTCIKCKKSYLLSNFRKDKHRKDGLQDYCKGCRGAMDKKLRDKGKKYLKKNFMTMEPSGRNMLHSGYMIVRFKNAYMLEHRFIMARHLGRWLESWEQIHHKNRDTGDNRIENLLLVSESLHDESSHHKGVITNLRKKIKELEEKIKILNLSKHH